MSRCTTVRLQAGIRRPSRQWSPPRWYASVRARPTATNRLRGGSTARMDRAGAGDDAGRPPKFPRWGGRSLAARKRQGPSSYSGTSPDWSLSQRDRNPRSPATGMASCRVRKSWSSQVAAGGTGFKPSCSDRRGYPVDRSRKAASWLTVELAFTSDAHNRIQTTIERRSYSSTKFRWCGFLQRCSAFVRGN